MSSALIYAILANLCFSSGSILFTKYSRDFGALRFNTYKAQIALVFFFLTVLFFPISFFPNFDGFIYLSLSGIIGLAIGDIFVFSAFKEIGPARTLTLFGFRPIIIALLNYLIIGTSIKNEDIYPTIFFILCLLVFAKENYQVSKSFQIKGILIGLFGVFLDSSGVILSRIVFNENTEMTTFHANLVRTIAALIALKSICYMRNKSFKTISLKASLLDKKIIFAPILGTYFALAFFMEAVKTGNLIIISAIGITGPIFASIIECIIKKEKPSSYLIWALLFFIIGILFRTYLMQA